MIVQNVSAVATGRTDISFTLPRDDGQIAMTTLRRLQESMGFESLLYDDRIGKVSLIGAGMGTYHPGVTGDGSSARCRRGSEHRDDLHLGDQDLGGGGPPASSPSSWSTTTEILISEVEIILRCSRPRRRRR